jgi:hypothetical protein
MKRLLAISLLVLLLGSCTTMRKWVNPVPINQLEEGQTTAEVREFCRFPDRVNTTIVEGVQVEQWVYNSSGMHLEPVYLYFRDGILVGWQY